MKCCGLGGRTGPVLEGRNLRVSFAGGRVCALDGISVGFGEATVTGLLGPNGAGKSTLLKVLAGLIPPDTGSVSVTGRIGFVPDRPGFYHLSGLEWMTAFGRMDGVNRREAKERGFALLERYGLGDAADRPVAGYSRGMLQRFLIAQAMLGDPKILLMDEPSAGLDPFGTDALRMVLKTLCEDGKVVVLTSHQVGEVEETCDRVILIVAGRMLEDTSPGALVDRFGSLAAGYREILRGGGWQ